MLEILTNIDKGFIDGKYPRSQALQKVPTLAVIFPTIATSISSYRGSSVWRISRYLK